jgi:hypothetical protein
VRPLRSPKVSSTSRTGHPALPSLLARIVALGNPEPALSLARALVHFRVPQGVITGRGLPRFGFAFTSAWCPSAEADAGRGRRGREVVCRRDYARR